MIAAVVPTVHTTGVNWHGLLANVISIGGTVGGFITWTMRRLESRRKIHERWVVQVISVAVREATIALSGRLDSQGTELAAQGRTLDEVQRRTGRIEDNLMSGRPP